MPAPAPNLVGDLLRELVSALNNALPQLGAVRVNDGVDWTDNLPATGRVAVLPKRQRTQGHTHGANQKRVGVDIGFAKHIPDTTDATIDAALAWVQTVESLWDGEGALREADIAGCSWVAINRDPIYSVKAVKEQHLFTCAITIEFSTDV